MVKTMGTKSAKPKKVVFGDSGGSKKEYGDRAEPMGRYKVGNNEVKDDEVGKNQKTSKSKKSSKSKKTVGFSNFFTSRAKLLFIKLRQIFLETLILHHFNPKDHIWIETDISVYAISGVFSQLTLDNLNQWHPITLFSLKMIPVETRYEIYNDKLLAIIEVFKTWRHYLEKSQHVVLLLTIYNNLGWFMDMKSLTSKEVCWAQKLSYYHFQMDYYQGKENGAANTLSQYL